MPPFEISEISRNILEKAEIFVNISFILGKSSQKGVYIKEDKLGNISVKFFKTGSHLTHISIVFREKNYR
ncbi:MAG: hypothetical protein LBF22_00795 [Deltaproteobacteria bacterium]|nr:hypothetical protein [Deltaproteobacteria bacterium]